MINQSAHLVILCAREFYFATEQFHLTFYILDKSTNPCGKGCPAFIGREICPWAWYPPKSRLGDTWFCDGKCGGFSAFVPSEDDLSMFI